MAVPAVANDVQDNIGAELHAELRRHPGAEDDCLRIVAVYVQDRRLNRFRHVGAVQPGIGVRRHCREPDLVIHDDVDGATGAVPDQLAHRQRLVNQALAGECGVAVHQNAHNRPPARIARLILPGSDLAYDDRINRFQMRRVWLQRQMYLAAVNVDVGRCPEVVFDIPGALHIVRFETASAEFAKQGSQWLLHDVDQGIQPAAVRHPDGDFIHALPRHSLDNRLYGWDGCFPAFQPESLRCHVASLTEGLEALGFGKLPKDGPLGVRIEGREPGGSLHLTLDPGLLFGVLDVHELHADMAAIGLPQDGQDFPQAGRLAP